MFLVTLDINGSNLSIEVAGGHHIAPNAVGEQYIETNYHNYLLSEIIQSYMVGDLCLVGSRGSGKSMLVRQIAKILNQAIEPMVLYRVIQFFNLH